MAGGVGRPGANIAAGMPQAQAQQGAMPSQGLGPNVNNFAAGGPAMPLFGGMRQFNPTAMIQRAAFNPAAAQAQPGYGAPRQTPNFAWAANVPKPQASAASSQQAQPSDYQKMRDELDQLRAWQSQYTGNNGGGGGGN